MLVENSTFQARTQILFFKIRSVCVRVSPCVYLYMCLRVCVCIYTCIYKYIYICSYTDLIPQRRGARRGTRAAGRKAPSVCRACKLGWDGTGWADPVCSLPVPLPFSLAPHQPPAATSLQEAKRQHDKASNSQT